MTSEIDCFPELGGVFAVSFASYISLLESSLGFWSVDVCGIFVGTLDLVCLEKSPLLSQGPPHPYRAVFCALWVGSAGRGEAPEGPCSCDFSAVGLGFFPAPLAPTPACSLCSPAASLGLAHIEGTCAAATLQTWLPQAPQEAWAHSSWVPIPPPPPWPGPLCHPFRLHPWSAVSSHCCGLSQLAASQTCSLSPAAQAEPGKGPATLGLTPPALTLRTNIRGERCSGNVC